MLKALTDLEVQNKQIVLRADLDVGEDFEEGDDQKLKTILETTKYLQKNNASILMMGHRGRPGGKADRRLSLKPVKERLEKILDTSIGFISELQEYESKIQQIAPGDILMLENLRFWKEEKENDPDFVKKLASVADGYVNEAFSVSHRRHASIVGLPEYIKRRRSNSVALGFHFTKEIENLNRVLQDPERPVISVLGGAKEDKLVYAEKFKKFADKILIGGRLPVFLEEDYQDDKYIVAKLNADQEDITVRSIELFEQEISGAKTIVVNGPMGKFEDKGQRLGTKRVFEAAANNKDAFRVAGGGDTGQAVVEFGLMDDFDWVSVGGGASLDFLADGSLPGIEVLK